MAKWRKTNRSKKVFRACGNNKSCEYCRSNRLHSTNKRKLAQVAQLAEQPTFNR